MRLGTKKDYHRVRDLLAEKKLSEEELIQLVILGDLHREAVKQLLRYYPWQTRETNLLYIIRFADSFRHLAWKRLRKFGVTNNGLLYIMEYVEPYRERAWRLFLKQKPRYNEFRIIVESQPWLEPRAAQQMWKRWPYNETLLYLVKRSKSMRKKAWRILKGKPSAKELMGVVLFVPDLREEAGKLLLKELREELAPVQLQAIAREVPSLRKKINKLL